ncbi:DUF3973 domain-containing protein [Paenibacillus hamazuiensis]
MYWCIRCRAFHHKSKTKSDTIFNTGFIYINNTLYPVGICSTLISKPKNN